MTQQSDAKDIGEINRRIREGLAEIRRGHTVTLNGVQYVLVSTDKKKIVVLPM